MNTITNNELEFIKKKMEDKEFTQALSACNTPKEYQEVFEAHGMKISLEDVEKAIQNAKDPNFIDSIEVVDDLNETDLENVSGGSLFLVIGASYVVASFMIGYNWKDYKDIYNRLTGRK